MYVKVIQHRENGRRRPKTDLARDSGATGRLDVHVLSNHPVMHLYQWGPQSTMQPDVLYPIYQPQIVSLSERGMIVRGLQRAAMSAVEDAATCLQEWSIDFLREAPPTRDIFSESHKLG